MALLEILTFPNATLREKCEPVTAFDKDLARLADNMLETMYDAPGVGLAANQVGVLKRVLVIDVDFDVEGDDDETRTLVNKNPRVFVNPKIVAKKGDTIYREGCLSLPGAYEMVKRYDDVTIEYQDVKGAKQKLEADGLLAIAIQHEMDHLDGKLFIDRLSEVKKGLVRGKLLKQRSKKFERDRFHVEL